MNATQLKHLKERLREVKDQKSYGFKNSKYGYTLKEKTKLFEEGRYKVVLGPYKDYTIEWEGEKELKERTYERIDKIEKEYQEILDQVVLGDAQEALKMLEDFRNKEFN